ncbi:amidohydrolase family protein [Variovorax dokdonensis]|uniref:Amidohydrolase family protein n=1 Tax=Variovorax dokdonensis TaxID=344883 RepID=A0ABT7N8X7_9BURK|nr:amidohydrolase family protein [Variovorax dokdonensis]MDM0044400.1 amidohydrolase family protein [Variovorax dokdonensis]
MMKLIFSSPWVCRLGVALCVAPAISTAAASSGPSAWVLERVTVVDVKTGNLSPGMSLLIEGGKIARIASAASIARGSDIVRVDGAGRFVVPGYLDMHAHPLNAPDPRPSLKLMLSNGITGYRQMSGSPELLRARQEKKLEFDDSPALLAMPGTILTDALAPTPDAARGQVKKQKADGADFIKTVGLSSANFYAAGAEAQAQGLPYVGHMNMDVDVRQAARVMRSIEHLGPMEVMLLGCSSEEPAIRDGMAHAHVEPPQIGPPSTPQAQAAIARMIANPAMNVKPHQFANMRRVIDSFDATRCGELARELIKDGAWQAPTLIRLRTMELADDPAYRGDANLRFMPVPVQQMWRELSAQFGQRISQVDRDTYRRFFALQLRFVKLLQDSGVPLLAGSDAGGSIWVVPGFSLHQEFDLLEAAGLTPLQVLQSATINGARFLGREAHLGSVEAGRTADLVLLDDNPLGSVANLHRIAGVVRSGHYYDAPALHRLQATALP